MKINSAISGKKEKLINLDQQNSNIITGQMMVLVPKNLHEVTKFANMLFLSESCGKDCQNAFQVAAKIIAGMECGMSPMEAVGAYAIINGRLTLWGVACTKRLRKHGWTIERVKHTQQECEVKITKGSESYSFGVTLADLKRMMPPKSQATSFAPFDKMFWHCVGRLIRYYVPEVFEGTGVQYIQEELAEEPTVKVVQPSTPTPTLIPEDQALDLDSPELGFTSEFVNAEATSSAEKINQLPY